MQKKIIVATRVSPLAMKQAEMAVEYFSKKMPGAEFEILGLKTTGDRNANWSLEQAGGKGLFTKELEEALLDGRADIAVHSAKDVPTERPAGLKLAACLPRGDSRDVLILKEGKADISLIATGSPRRRAQLKKMFPNAVWGEMRGNVGTRLKKILAGDADATVLSAAGLGRLGITSEDGLEFRHMKFQCSVPAVGQGIIAVECREADAAEFAVLGDAGTYEALALEREFLIQLGGGCQTAFGAHYDGGLFHVFHEKIGYQKLDLGVYPDFAEKLSHVSSLARGLKDG